MSNFIHFGCWNNLNEGCLETVMTRLNTRLDNLPLIDFLTVAGDNYYTLKELYKGKKKKIIIPEKLNLGFSYLPKDVDIYMILGNHDLETNTGKNNFFINNLENSVLKNDCKVIEYENIAVGDNRKIDYKLSHEKMLQNGTLVLMIDTSMYESTAQLFIPCYKAFLHDESITIEKLQAQQLEFIKETVDKYDGEIKNLIIIGHHPIIGLKLKKSENNIVQDIVNFDNVLKEIYELLKDSVNYFYLCADVHLYQSGNISLKINEESNMKIQQYIVGTGGTNLDKCPIDTEFEDERLIYVMTECKEKCGFLECNTNSDIPKFIFYEADFGGGKKIRMKKKTRMNKKTRMKKRRNNKSIKRKYK